MATARNHETLCKKCGKHVFVFEHLTGVPGGKEKEEASCPNCGNVVYEAMTDGWFETSIIEEQESPVLGTHTFGKTIVTDTGIEYSFLATKRENDFYELWRVLGKCEKDYVFDILYHIGTKDIETNDYTDFCRAYLYALKFSQNEDIAKESPIHNDFQKYFIKTIRESDIKVNLQTIINEELL